MPVYDALYSNMRILHFQHVLIDGRYPNGSISVMNACRKKAPDGTLNTIRGYAYRPNENEQGKLKVVFGGRGSGGDCKYIQAC